MAVVKFEKNGQGFYDFDALLDATSVDFVELVESRIKYLNKRNEEFSVKMDLDVELYSVVYIIGRKSVSIYRYESGRIQTMQLANFELMELVGEMHV